jgi:D-alanyl-D-alanine carboxypeptidase-like protein
VAAVVAAVLAGCGPASAAPVDAASASAHAATSALVWGLPQPARDARRLRRHAQVVDATVVGRGVVLLRRSRDGGGTVQKVRAGYAIPLDTIAVDPRRYARTVPAEADAFARLRRGSAVISRTEARLRRVGVGAVFDLADGRRVRVIAVVDDAVLRDAEVALPAGDPRMPPLRSTVVVGLRAPVTLRRLRRWSQRGAAAKLLPDGPGDIGPVRPATLKGPFGEPAVGLPYGSDWIRLSPAFVRRSIVSRRVPILGTVSCHRAMVPHLRAAMTELVRRGLSHTVDPGDYAGCYAPRRIQPRGQLSLHAWGLAVDLNASRNPFRGTSHQDPRLVRVMEKHGFTWGGRWPTRPDPMHFEYRGSGAPSG